MLNRIQVTTVFVNDQDKAKDFYVNTLGLALKVDQQMGPDFRWLEVAPDGAETSIALAVPFPGTAQTIGGPTGMIFDTGDVKAAHSSLKAKGVRFTQEPTAQPWGGVEAQFSDPDGNVFSVVERTQ
jgi:predicted enzyme related to lactoylglutathione lyase